jgi:hypothetical protein
LSRPLRAKTANHFTSVGAFCSRKQRNAKQLQVLIAAILPKNSEMSNNCAHLPSHQKPHVAASPGTELSNEADINYSGLLGVGEFAS